MSMTGKTGIASCLRALVKLVILLRPSACQAKKFRLASSQQSLAELAKRHQPLVVWYLARPAGTYMSLVWNMCRSLEKLALDVTVEYLP